MTHNHNRIKTIKNAFKAAFPYTVPILSGFLFLGIAYGIYMNASGFRPFYPMVMSAVIFAGSMEFVTVNLLLGAFDPLRAFLLTLMVNARHIFYGISLLEKYKGTGAKKPYLIFGLCDESFSINCTIDPPETIDRGWFMFFVTVLNHFYWVLGSSLGGILGPFLHFNTKGIEFVMTALFIVIFIERWTKEPKHYSALLGLVLPILCLYLFGSENFIIPSMLLIFCCLTFLRKLFEKAGAYL